MGAITNAIATDRESRQKIVACKDEQANNNINSHNVKKVNKNNNNDYTVNMICDFIDYLIKFNVNRSVSVVKMDLLPLQQQHTTNDQIVVDKAKPYYELADETATKPVTSNGSYTSFDELLRLTERQRAMEATGMDLSRCLRLRGGGESSLNNGTSAWGSPPATAGTASWGAPQQQGGWGNAGPNTNQRPDLGKPMQPPQGGNGGPLVGPNNSGSNSWNQVVKPPLQPPPQQQPPMQPNQPGPPGGNPGNNSNQPPSVNQQQQPPPQPAPGVNPQPGVPTQTSSAKLEHLNSMREALFAVDGWGCQHVNQDTQWDVPASPEPAKDAIKMNINNGTELWETNLRNGGQPTQQPTQKVPWCPQGNHGGTWGVDDDNNPENNSVWAGGAGGGAGAAALPPGGGGGGNGNPPVAGQPNWNQNSGAMWPPNVANAPPKKEPEWTGNVGVAGAGGNNWESRGAVAPPPPPHIPAPPLDMGNVDMRSMRPPGSIEPNREFRGDPRGISGRLNGNSSGMWEQHPMPNTPLNKMPPQAPLLNATGNQWPVGAGGPQNIPPTKPQPGWDEASPPANRRNISNMDEPSSLWGAPANMNRPNGLDAMVRNGRNPLGGNSGPIGPGGLGGPRLGGPGNQMKSDNMWGHGGPGAIRNGSWGDDGNVGNWEEKGPGPQGGVGGGSTWNEGNPATWNNNKKPMVGGGNVWPETSDLIGGEWGAGVGKPPNKHNPQDIIRSSKQFRILYEMGFKKEDIEQALRTANMSLEEAMEMLQTQRNNGNNMTDWRRHDDHPGGGFEPPFSGGRFPGGGNGPSLPFPQNPNGPNNINNNMPGGMGGGGGGGGGNPNLAGLNSLSKANLQSYLNQAPPSGPGGPFNQGGPNGMGGAGGAGTGGGLGGQNSSAQPSTQQLRMLVQQIQMAVQAGYLNHQILNQPLAPQTLFLLNQLLNNIKQLQVTQNSLQRGGAGGNAQMSMIPKIKQQIAGLQNQIATQQAIYVKQQQQQQQQQSGGSSNVGGHLGGNFHREQNDLTTLQNSLSEMGLGGKDPSGPYHHGPGGGGAGNSGGGSGATSQQSRLNQWKLPAMDKDSSHDLTDFSRAPGTTAKSSLAAPGSGMPGLGGLQGDNTWSTGRGSIGDGWPDSSADVGSKDWPSNQDSFTDLVPEFEPGKPWKGNQMKIEEDPTITPGSIARSPIASISIGSAKDSDLFAGSSKPSPTDSISLSSSTWSFNPNNNFTSSISKLAENKNTWSDSGTSDLWGSGLGGGGGGGAGAASKAPRGPPPGLSAGKNPGGGGGFGSNGWNQRPGPTGGNWAGGPAWYSTWVLLKNLTAQIDGSTLRTLCMQHGPVQNFHLYLNHGIALCKYLSREEANKAQQALNNCVLGNTTICAESPLASEVQTILQHLGIPGGANNNNINNNNNGNINVGSAGLGNSNNNNNAQPWRSSGSQQANIRSAADTWGSGWPSSGAGANLWTPLDGPTERGTPSNLNSFLPENLLGGELN